MLVYDESGYFDPSHLHHPNPMGGSLLDGHPEASMGLDHLHHQLGFDLEQDFHDHLMPEAAAAPGAGDNWNPGQLPDAHLHLPQYDGELAYAAAAAAAPDLLNLLHLPRCTVAPPVLPPGPPGGAISFGSPGGRAAAGFPVDVFAGEVPGSDVGGSAGFYLDPSVQPHLLRELFHTLPQGYGLLYGMEGEAGEVGGGGGVFREGEGGELEDGVFDFRRVEACRREGKGSFATEKQRREQLNEKYQLLKSLVPNPTKSDRASIVSDAIDFINELKRTIEELTIIVDNKKYGRNRKMKMEEDAAADMESSSMRSLIDDADPPFNGSLRSSWLQRRSKESFVDVRIVDDEVNIKVTRRKKANCLLSASKAIEELQLELVHVSGGHIGDCYIFMFNTKISEGSSVYASAVAMKLLEVMDKPCPTFPIRF